MSDPPTQAPIAVVVPPPHLVRAALQAADLIDRQGSPVPAARGAYNHLPSDALYPPEDLRRGERLLVTCGLLYEDDGRLHPTQALLQLLALTESEAVAVIIERALLASVSLVAPTQGMKALDQVEQQLETSHLSAEHREAILLSLAQRFDAGWREQVGAVGEDFVADHARQELLDLGLDEQANGVRRVGGIVDSLGYDVVAPRLTGTRRLEVKTTTVAPREGRVRFFLSRAEYARGLADIDWAIVVCVADLQNDRVQLVGWCRAIALEPYAPPDGQASRWTQAQFDIPTTLLEAGLPPVN